MREVASESIGQAVGVANEGVAGRRHRPGRASQSLIAAAGEAFNDGTRIAFGGMAVVAITAGLFLSRWIPDQLPGAQAVRRPMRLTPASRRSKEAVLDAAGELLGEEGARRVHVDAVARRSGVARTTIYRHWPEPSALLFDAFRYGVEPTPVPDTGSVRDDLVELYTHLSEKLPGTCYGRLLPVLLDAAVARRGPCGPCTASSSASAASPRAR